MNNEFIIGTFNVQNEYKNNNQDYNNKINKLIKFIYDNNICCLGLQEVTPKYFEILKKLIKKDYNIYGDYRFKNLKFTEKLNESVKILSKYKTQKSKTIYLSKFIFFPRIMTTLETDDFLFINVHLEFWSTYFRNKELNNLYKFINLNKEKNIILVGDFNVKYDDKHFLNFINKLSKLDINLVNNKENTHKNTIIDYIFISNKYEILDTWVEKDLKDIRNAKTYIRVSPVQKLNCGCHISCGAQEKIEDIINENKSARSKLLKEFDGLSKEMKLLIIENMMKNID